MVFPLPKITDMALSADICRPAHRILYDRFVNPDREQDDPVLLAFLFKGRFDLLLDPTALDRMFREDEEETVVYLNRLIDTDRNSSPIFKSSGANQQRTFWA